MAEKKTGQHKQSDSVHWLIHTLECVHISLSKALSSYSPSCNCELVISCLYSPRVRALAINLAPSTARRCARTLNVRSDP